MEEDLGNKEENAGDAIEYRDTLSIIESALVKLAISNKEAAKFLADTAESGFFDIHQTGGSIDRLALSLLKTIKERE